MILLSRPGAEVLYIFVSKVDSKIVRSKKELKFFHKFSLAPKEMAQIPFSLKFRDFAYYDEYQKVWAIEPGLYHIILARSASEVLEFKTVDLR